MFAAACGGTTHQCKLTLKARPEWEWCSGSLRWCSIPKGVGCQLVVGPTVHSDEIVQLILYEVMPCQQSIRTW